MDLSRLGTMIGNVVKVESVTSSFDSREKASRVTLFGLLQQPDTVVPKVRSKQVVKGSFFLPVSGLSYGRQPTGSIKLEALESPSTKRRSSFLPAGLQFDNAVEAPRRSSYVYEGATVYKMEKAGKHTYTVRKFCTGSKYSGEVNQLGIAGKGVYKLPHGVIYDGYFNRKGEFHGTGTLIYPAGQRIEGVWRNGKMAKGASFVSADNRPMISQYCKMPDRRFQIEVESDIMPAGQEYLTNAPVARTVPSGMYDSGTGFYDPHSRTIIDYSDMEKHKPISEAHDDEKAIIYNLLLEKTLSDEAFLGGIKKRTIPRIRMIEEVPAEDYEAWIVNNCRKGFDANVGYRKDLYEVWDPGYRRISKYPSIEVMPTVSPSMDDELVRLSHVKDLATIYTNPRNSKRNKYSKLYSFIYAHGQNLHKYIQESKKTSAQELRDMFMPMEPAPEDQKKNVYHMQRKLRRTLKRSISSDWSAANMPKHGGSYGLKYLLKHEGSLGKKLMVHMRSNEDALDD